VPGVGGRGALGGRPPGLGPGHPGGAAAGVGLVGRLRPGAYVGRLPRVSSNPVGIPQFSASPPMPRNAIFADLRAILADQALWKAIYVGNKSVMSTKSLISAKIALHGQEGAVTIC